MPGRRYFAFLYRPRQGLEQPAARLAGSLHWFPTEEERDAWVSAGTSMPTYDGRREWRIALRGTDSLPRGWSEEDAVCVLCGQTECDCFGPLELGKSPSANHPF